MTDILCRWLNEELRLSQIIEPKTFAQAFSSGYLFGEILHKYQLQNDFHMFMKKERSISRLNNFTRLEPTLKLLGISFNATTTQELMQEKQGVAERIVYQLYVSLERKKKADISGTVMKIMQPAAAASLHKKEHDIYCDRLHKEVKRDVQVNLEKISKHYQDKCQQISRSVVPKADQKKKPLSVHDEKSKRNINKVQVCRQKHNDLFPCDQNSVFRAPKSPPHPSQLNLRKQQRTEQQAQDVQNEIAQFEMNKRKMTSTLSHPSHFGELPMDDSRRYTEVHGVKSKLVLQSNSMYIQQIQQRLKEDVIAREQREKRVDRFLVEQFKARVAEQDAQYEECLAKRLTRPTKQEQRLVAQLLQIRKQKEVILNNRLFREQQIQRRREKDFQEALKREAALAEQERMARAEEVKKELEFCKSLAAERDQNRYQKHSQSCEEIVEQIVDLTTKIGEYRLLTEKEVPEKQMKDWKELLFSGLPLYEPTNMDDSDLSTALDPIELKKHDLLNNQDYDEYINMIGEWVWPEEAGETKLPPTNNNILGHVVTRLRNLVHPPSVKPAESPFPHFSLKACVLGKICSGKTSCLAKIAQAHGIYVLSADTLVKEALNAYNREMVRGKQKEADNEKQTVSTEDNQNPPKEPTDIKVSVQAMYGAAADKVMREGKFIPNELLVDIITEAIKQIPANSGWILDGFPVDIFQAHLLGKALGGAVDEGPKVTNNRMNLAVDPDPPKTPAAPPPALDLALLLDVSDERAVTIAFNQSDVATDKYLYLAQVPHRVTAFQDTWPKLEEWFGVKQNILVHVDANVDEEQLFQSVELVLQQVKRPLPEVFATPPDDHVVLDGGAGLDVLSTPLSLDQSLNQIPTAPKPNPTEPSASLQVEHEESVKLLTSTNNSKETSRRPSLTSEDSLEYADEPLPPGIPEALHQHWDTVCEMYVNKIKALMQELRLERSVINQHLFNIREEFKHYLGRPDLRQELVSQWQKDFNNLPDEMREDEETKAELHLRLDDLYERLMDISDKRKEENKQERAALMEDGWLVDHTALIINYHLILLQVELDRFQNTFCILEKYYLCMDNKSLPEPPSSLTCISLLDTSGMHASEKHSQAQTEQSQVSAQAHQRKTKKRETKEKVQEKEKPPSSADKNSKKVQSAKKKKGAPSPPPPPSPAPAEVKPSDNAANSKTSGRAKIYKEYVAALKHEMEAAKIRIALVKGHGLQMVNFLQSDAKQTFRRMKKWLEEHFANEMKSIEQLAEVVRHHIESGTKLQNVLVLECTNFCLSGDYHMVATPPPPSRPPPLEKPTQCTLTITQLQCLCLQFTYVAPSGLLSCLEFSTLLKDILSANRGRNTLPELWVKMSETQLIEIVSLLKDEYEFVDWRRFMLSCAQPWPLPSLTQLLDILQHFKAADIENRGYISEEQYLQTHLWFPKDSVQSIPEDPSEPLPYDRLSNLCKFFFQMFADHSSTPPRLNYVSMLQYLAADANPKQGFIRALSVVLGQHLRHSSSSHFVKSMPSLDEAPEFSSPEFDGDYNQDESLGTSSTLLGNQKVSMSALFTVISHSSPLMKKGHFPPSCVSQADYTEQLVCMFRDLGYEPEASVPFSVLSQHPFTQHLMEASTQHQLVNIYKVLKDDGGEYNG